MKFNNKRTKDFIVKLVILIIGIAALMSMNVLLIYSTSFSQQQILGQMRLSSVATQVEKLLSIAENEASLHSLQVEQILKDNPDDYMEELTGYLYSQAISLIEQEDSSSMTVYAASEDWILLYGFDPPSDYVITERSWYIGAKNNPGQFHITEAYQDARTGKMCFSISKMLSDMKTVICMDFNLDQIQQFIVDMNEADGGTSFITNEKGLIIGSNDANLIGVDYTHIDKFSEIFEKVFNFHGQSFTTSIDNVRTVIFSDKTEHNWYLIICVPMNNLIASNISQYGVVLAVMLVLSLSIVLFFFSSYRNKVIANNALNAKDEFLETITRSIKNPVTEIMHYSKQDAAENGEATLASIQASALELTKVVDDLALLTKLNNEEKSKQKYSEGFMSLGKNTKTKMIIILIFTGIIACGINTVTQMQLGEKRINDELNTYSDQVAKWAIQHTALIEMLSNSIGAQVEFYSEYEYDIAVKYLDAIAQNYESISVLYIANPDFDHSVIMNNGWEPPEGWSIEDRSWYKNTISLEDNDVYISHPYADERTGMHCVTISKKVYTPEGDYIGILAMDFYIDKLVNILDSSYTSEGYAFLVDDNYNIINHPHADYQMSIGKSRNLANLSYREAVIDEKLTIIKDYDSNRKICIAKREENSGFSVLVVKNWTSVYGNLILLDLIILVTFFCCIYYINKLMKQLNYWQYSVNIELENSANKAIEAGKAKSNFLANMSHEIRTPINAIIGMNELILRESKDSSVTGYAENINEASQALLSVINDVLDFSKMELNMMEIVPVEYSTVSFIDHLVLMSKDRANKKGLAFVLDIDEELPLTLIGDDVKLAQVVVNMLTNAVKYTAKGEVTLGIKILEKNENSYKLKYYVKDTGIGIKKEDYDKLFISFQRLDIEQNRNIEGSGLGISIIDHLLRKMGTHFDLESEYGVGSIFSFEMEQEAVNSEPIGNYLETSKAKSKGRNSIEKSFVAENARILIVDDNDMNLMVIRDLLKRTKMQLTLLSSGFECLDILQTQSFDLIILDDMMAKMDGVETLKKIKAQKLAENIPIIILTANAISGAKSHYLESGFDDYLSKPVFSQQLEETLIKWLPKELVTIVELNNQPIVTEDVEFSANDKIDFNSAHKYANNDEQSMISNINYFLNNVPQVKGNLETAYEQKDKELYRITSHSLKSTSAIVGGKYLHPIAKEMEELAKKQEDETIWNKHQGLMKIYDEFVAALQEYISNTVKEVELDETTDKNKVIMQIKKDMLSCMEQFDIIGLQEHFEQLKPYLKEEEIAKYSEIVEELDSDSLQKTL